MCGLEQLLLPNGLRIVTEGMAEFRSLSIGVFVRSGSMTESEKENGLSHFLEHMAFKGTAHRSAKDIAAETDAIGGQMNADTARTFTCYYTTVLEEDLEEAVDILADMVLSPKHAPEDMETERGVIREEIGMEEDSPEESVFDLLDEAMYPGQNLGRSILGTQEHIARVTAGELRAFYRKMYKPSNTVVSAAGRFDEKKLYDLLGARFSAWRGSGADAYPDQTVIPEGKTVARDKDTEQTHLCIGCRGVPAGAKEGYAWSVLNNIIGGTVSSRLFQQIREERGLAYSVYSSLSAYPGCGDFAIYAACAPKKAQEVLRRIDGVLRGLADGMEEKEFLRAKAQLKSAVVLGLESTGSRMNHHGVNMLLLDRPVGTEEMIRQIDDVTREDVQEAVAQLCASPRCFAFLGTGAEKIKVES